MGYSPRYHIGYNRPIRGAVGDSPKEWHTDAETDNLEIAKQHCRQLRKDGHANAVLFDTGTNEVIEV